MTKQWPKKDSAEPKLPVAEIAKKVVNALNDKRGIYATLDAKDGPTAKVSFTYRGTTYQLTVEEA